MKFGLATETVVAGKHLQRQIGKCGLPGKTLQMKLLWEKKLGEKDVED